MGFSILAHFIMEGRNNEKRMLPILCMCGDYHEPHCQLERDRLRAVNAMLLEALETLLMGYDSLGEHEPVSNLIAGARMAREAIKEARK